MKIIDGKEISNQIKQEIKIQVDGIISNGNRPPHLAAVIVGNSPFQTVKSLTEFVYKKISE